MKNTKWRWHDC